MAIVTLTLPHLSLSLIMNFKLLTTILFCSNVIMCSLLGEKGPIIPQEHNSNNSGKMIVEGCRGRRISASISRSSNSYSRSASASYSYSESKSLSLCDFERIPACRPSHRPRCHNPCRPKKRHCHKKSSNDRRHCHRHHHSKRHGKHCKKHRGNRRTCSVWLSA